MIRSLCAAALVATLAAAQAAERGFNLVIAGGRAGELCLPLKAGDVLAWRFSASAPVAFNLHHHVGAEVRMPLQREALAADRGTHPIDVDNDWCLMWTAPAGPRVTVSGAWSRWQDKALPTIAPRP